MVAFFADVGFADIFGAVGGAESFALSVVEPIVTDAFGTSGSVICDGMSKAVNDASVTEEFVRRKDEVRVALLALVFGGVVYLALNDV